MKNFYNLGKVKTKEEFAELLQKAQDHDNKEAQFIVEIVFESSNFKFILDSPIKSEEIHKNWIEIVDNWEEENFKEFLKFKDQSEKVNEIEQIRLKKIQEIQTKLSEIEAKIINNDPYLKKLEQYTTKGLQITSELRALERDYKSYIDNNYSLASRYILSSNSPYELKFVELLDVFTNFRKKAQFLGKFETNPILIAYEKLELKKELDFCNGKILNKNEDGKLSLFEKVVQFHKMIQDLQLAQNYQENSNLESTMANENKSATLLIEEKKDEVFENKIINSKNKEEKAFEKENQNLEENQTQNSKNEKNAHKMSIFINNMIKKFQNFKNFIVSKLTFNFKKSHKDEPNIDDKSLKDNQLIKANKFLDPYVPKYANQAYENSKKNEKELANKQEQDISSFEKSSQEQNQPSDFNLINETTERKPLENYLINTQNKDESQSNLDNNKKPKKSILRRFTSPIKNPRKFIRFKIKNKFTVKSKK